MMPIKSKVVPIQKSRAFWQISYLFGTVGMMTDKFHDMGHLEASDPLESKPLKTHRRLTETNGIVLFPLPLALALMGQST
jgi:hypothetical protein